MKRRTDLYCLLALCWFGELVEKKVQAHDANQVDVFEVPQSPTWTITQHAKPPSPTMLLPLFLIYITPRTHFWASATVDFLLMFNNPDKASSLCLLACHDKTSPLGGLHNRNYCLIIYFQLWRLEVQSDDVGRVGSF